VVRGRRPDPGGVLTDEKRESRLSAHRLVGPYDPRRSAWRGVLIANTLTHKGSLIHEDQRARFDPTPAKHRLCH